ncbi:MAG: tetratricopeptide repeat protein, partial [Anaerolineales bacterium]|nr:tetratricopeptide repeat protein [Anaerolineales bacterium]
GETAVIQARHAAYYAQFLDKQRARLRAPQQKTAADTIGHELDNVRLAWQWSVAHTTTTADAWQNLAAAADSFWLFLLNRGMVLEGRDLFGAAVAAVDDLLMAQENPPVAQQLLLAELLGWLGMFFFDLGQFIEQSLAFERALTLLRSLLAQDVDSETAVAIKRHMIIPLAYHSYRVSITGAETEGRQMLEDAIAFSREIGDNWRLSQALNVKAIRTNSVTEKRRLFQEYLTVAQEAGDLQNIARAQMNLSTTQDGQDDVQTLLLAALQIYRRLETPKGVAYVYVNLADGAFQSADYHTARQYYDQALQLFNEIGSNTGVLTTLYGMGNTYWALHDLEAAQQQLTRTLAYARERGDLENTIKLLNNMATFMVESGDMKGATEKYLEALALLSQLQTDHQRAEALDSLGNLALLLGKYDAAKRHFSKNKALFMQANDLRGVAWSVRNLGIIAYVLGDYEQARSYYEESLALHQQVNNVWGSIALLNDLGRTAFAMGDEETAVSHYRAALHLYHDNPVLPTSFPVVVDWARLLMKQGEKARALTYLTLVVQNPNFNPVAVDHFTRSKAERLLAELQADLPPQMLAEVEAAVQQRDYNEVIIELLEMDTAGLHES